MATTYAAMRQTTTEEGEWKPSVCGMCVYGQCATRVHVVNGVAVKVEGNPEALHNMGRLCPRGNATLMDLYDPYRVKVPMKRTNPEKGLDVDPKFVEISWDEAMDIITEKLRAVRAENSKGFFINGGLSGDRVGGGVFNALFGGTPIPWWGGQGGCGNAEHSVSLWAHYSALSGWDNEYTKYFIVLGAGCGSGSWLGGAACGVQWMADSRVERGMKVVVVDPRCTELGNKADEWVPIVPGTDLAFMLAIMHVMIHERNEFDVEFIRRHTNGPYLIRPDGHYMKEARDSGKPLVWDSAAKKARPFDLVDPKDAALEGAHEVNGELCKPAFQLLKEHLVPYTPEWAESISTVPAATTRRITAEFLKAAMIGATITMDGTEFPYRPVSIIGYHGLNRHVNGPENVMAFNLIDALVGCYDVPGGDRGWKSSEFGMPNIYQMPPPEDGMLELLPYAEVGAFPPDIDLHQFYPLAWDTVVNMNWTLADPQMREKFKIPYTVKAMYQNAGNEFRTMGDPRQTEKAMKAIDFVVSHALWVDDPTLFADVVIPDPAPLERMNIQQYIRLQQVDVKGIMLKQPVVKPLYNTRSVGEVLIDLADRLGFLYGEGGYLDMWNKAIIEGAVPWGYAAENPTPRLDINRKYTLEEMVDVTLKAKCGEDKGLDWFRTHGILMKKFTDDHDAKQAHLWAPHFGRRFPIYFEPLLGYGELLKQRVKENYGMDWDVSGYYPLPRWVPCPEHDASKFPPDFDLIVLNYKTAVNTHATSASNIWLGEVYEADPYLLRIWMNEETGKKKGLRDGDKVWLESTLAKVEGRVKLSQAIHPQAAAFHGGQGSWATNPVARKGINFATLIPLEREVHLNQVLCDHEWHTRVKVTKA